MATSLKIVEQDIATGQMELGKSSRGKTLFTNKDLNKNVTFYLGFSYAALRAFNVLDDE